MHAQSHHCTVFNLLLHVPKAQMAVGHKVALCHVRHRALDILNITVSFLNDLWLQGCTHERLGKNDSCKLSSFNEEELLGALSLGGASTNGALALDSSSSSIGVGSRGGRSKTTIPHPHRPLH